ncbi:30S ribosomal protein S1 [Marinicella sp. S1101]|uniref:30S ribosomal protein S1 n=1 Tax=Marinicella marina TaxID=2996016 RepID=UPI002260B7E4|nr:30S ribosomal protein S1 [Marinicella marina]MCX7554143.1 30S ribosomal protein S1 [Marinicella marina]MDJ1141164.1 30S ribosomal protein S1 [Marinicella marina]
MSDNFEAMLESELSSKNIIPGTIVKGIVVDIENGFAVVDAGLKSEGVIPLEEFGNEVEIDDVVEVALEKYENGFGETVLSREKAKRMLVWDQLKIAMDTDQIVIGQITSKVRGGFTVELKDIRAFLPGSLVDVRPVRDPGYLEGKDLEFKVIKLDQKRNNVVVSRRAVVESDYSEDRDKLLDSLEDGVIVKGIVKNLTDYGAFLDLGGIDGLLHITDMSWKRVNHPSEVVEIGQELEVRVLKFDKEQQRVSLGLKQLGEDPWKDLSRRHPVGSRHFGNVTNITDYGCFVEIEDGIEGLVHVSEIDWTNKNINPAKVVQPGDEVEVCILEIEENKRRISLGMKQCKPNPWVIFSENAQKGDVIEGKIKSITDFGIFIGLEGGIDGLVHLSDISWNEPGETAIRNFKKGDLVKATVLIIDAERERVSLGIKQLAQDPFGSYVANNPKGSLVTGKVIEVDEKEAVVELEEGVNGLIKAFDVAKERTDDVSAVLSVGDEVEAKFVSMDRRKKMLVLSIKAKESDELNDVLNEYKKGSSGTTSLGDLLKEKLDD